MDLMKPIDYLLDRITMYRLMLYYLLVLVAAAIGLSLTGHLQYNALGIALSAGYLTIICWLTNRLFAWVFEAPVNFESVYITALILSLIITPYKVPHDLLFLTAAGGLAIASKFIIAIRRKHIFNPAAVAVALTAAGAGQSASWWVGASSLLPVVLIGGLLVIRKTNRGWMVSSFLVATTASTLVLSVIGHHVVLSTLKATTLHSSLFFLAFVMLTEPLTSPSTRRQQLLYGGLAGLLFPPQIHLLSVYSTPELTLLVANAYAYVVSPKIKLTPRLIHKTKIAANTIDFVFKTERPLRYKPGQYMEWTLPHQTPDSRGNRRYFTLASSPTEANLRLGVKFYPRGSSYKRAMRDMDDRTLIAAGQLGGDFVLPDDTSQKLVFIAGGIGVTPFRSMVKYLIDTDDPRDVTLLYSVKSQPDLAYTDVFDRATHKLKAKVVYTLTDPQAIPASWTGHRGPITAKLLTDTVPGYADHLFYISGTHIMVGAMEDMLRGLGVPRHQIKTDFFPGYA